MTIGTRLHEALIAANEVEEADSSIGITVADARFMKPLDEEMIRDLVDDHSIIITVEEGSIGGFGDHVMHFLSNDGAFDEGKLKFRSMVLPDTYFEAGSQQEQYDMAGLNHQHIREQIMKLAQRRKVTKLEGVAVE